MVSANASKYISLFGYILCIIHNKNYDIHRDFLLLLNFHSEEVTKKRESIIKPDHENRNCLKFENRRVYWCDSVSTTIQHQTQILYISEISRPGLGTESIENYVHELCQCGISCKASVLLFRKTALISFEAIKTRLDEIPVPRFGRIDQLDKLYLSRWSLMNILSVIMVPMSRKNFLRKFKLISWYVIQLIIIQIRLRFVKYNWDHKWGFKGHSTTLFPMEYIAQSYYSWLLMNTRSNGFGGHQAGLDICWLNGFVGHLMGHLGSHGIVFIHESLGRL